MAKRMFEHTAKHDFLLMAEHDPTILTGRHCTSADVKHLGALAGIDRVRAQRAFTMCLFRRTAYLTRSLDPAFEPKPECRERAAETLRKRAEATVRAKQPLPTPKQAEMAIKPKKQPTHRTSKIARYSF